MVDRNTGLSKYANNLAKSAPPEVLAQLREIRNRLNSTARVKRPVEDTSSKPWNSGVIPLKQA